MAANHPTIRPRPSSLAPTNRASWLRWLYPVALSAMVVIASGRGQVAGPDIVNFDKLVHFGVFGLLATLVVRSPGLRHAWVAVLAVSLFGIGDEFRQSFTPGRFVEFADWVADTLGALTAVLAYVLWPAYRRLLEYPLRWPRRASRAACPARAHSSVSAPLPHENSA